VPVPAARAGDTGQQALDARDDQHAVTIAVSVTIVVDEAR
jgi:hypothetical protein